MRRVVIARYRSIAACDVTLRPLTFLVGPNGAGKSNFVDALRFCRDALRGPLDQAFASRAANLRSLSYSPTNGLPGFGMRFELSLPGSESSHYSYWIGPESVRGFAVQREECVVGDSTGRIQASFSVSSGVVQSSFTEQPVFNDSRLYLVNASGLPQFRPIYEALAGMEFYDPDPEAMKVDLDTSGPADILDSNGGNAASVFERISLEDPQSRARIEDYMRRIVPGLKGIKTESFKTYTLLSFQQAGADSDSLEFLASSMSDGTLRALAILIALFQSRRTAARPSLVAFEEPEKSVHPAAAGLLFDSLREGSNAVQVVVTSHSPDLLDSEEIPTDSILAVDYSTGSTQIGPIDPASRSALHDRLYSAGELLRMDQFRPDPGQISTLAAEHQLFDRPIT